MQRWFYGKPKHDGFYWLKLKSDRVPTIVDVSVTFDEDGLISFPGNDTPFSFNSRSLDINKKIFQGSQWFGPLTPPPFNENICEQEAITIEDI